MSTIGPLVARDLVNASPDDTVAAAVQMMSDRDVGAVLVVSNGRLEGIFSERDVMKRVLVRGLVPGETTLRDVATADPITIGESASVRECAYLIRENHFRHLPVLGEDGKVVGMISARDFLSQLASGFERVIQRVCETSDADECEDYYQHVVGDFVD